MNAIAVALIGLSGVALGSFLNVVIHRVPRGESVVRPGPRCARCATPVSLRGVVPVLSWLVVRARCPSCGARTSPRYPVVEILTGCAFAGVAVARGVDDDLLAELPFVAVLIACAAIDLEHRIVPNKLVVPAAVWGVAAGALVMTERLGELLLAGAGAFLALLAVALIQPRGMGMGDVKLAGVIGLYLGLSVVPALLVAFLSGSIMGVAIMARYGSGARKTAVPFGPFLALGGVVGVLGGPRLLEIYSTTFLH